MTRSRFLPILAQPRLINLSTAGDRGGGRLHFIYPKPDEFWKAIGDASVKNVPRTASTEDKDTTDSWYQGRHTPPVGGVDPFQDTTI